jgi:Fur family ferric uptake transcriptional regulator
MKISPTPPIAGLLKEAGLKATPGRLALLEHLRSQSKPMTIKEIHTGLKGQLDQVSIYRAVEALTEKGIVRRVDLRHPHAHYEMSMGRAHHHHIACSVCGRVEDVEDCETEGLEYRVLKASKQFANIQSHALEFYGVCKACAT